MPHNPMKILKRNTKSSTQRIPHTSHLPSNQLWTPWTRIEDLYLLKYVGYQISAKHIAELLYILSISEQKSTHFAVEKRSRFLRRRHNFNSKLGRLDDPFNVFLFLSQYFTLSGLSLSSQPERMLIKAIKGKPH